MDEPQNPEQPQPAPHHEAPAPGTRRVKRRLILTLIGLYALSVAAACFLVIRGQPTAPSDQATDKSGKRLLSLAERDVLGWISIHGPIYSSEGGRPWERGVEQWGRKLRRLSENKNVRAIILDINSPGGSVGAVQELYSQILRVRREKKIPVVALFGDVSASGGYYIAAACDKIIAHPGTLTGSIGVIFSVSNLQGLFGKIGYKVDPIKSGKHKDIGSPARPMTSEERQILQNLIDDAYGQFVQAVASGRNMTVEQVKPLADGRIFSGNQALEAKLVDKLGDSVDAIELAAGLAGLRGRPKVKRDSERFTDFFEILESKLRISFWTETGLAQTLKPPLGLEYRWAGW